MREKNVDVKSLPSLDSVETYWKTLWAEKSKFDAEAKWLPTLRHSYCPNAQQFNYEVTDTIVANILSKISSNKAPGPDFIVGYWYKNLEFHVPYLAALYNSCFEAKSAIPSWLSIAKTRLSPKCSETHLANNYRPIALQNVMYKLYTGCINAFLGDHCSRNNIITTEQAGGKKDVWGCTELLLINKMIQEEVAAGQRDLVCVWLDYQKAFHSVSHDWLLESLIPA